ncbi:CHASE4 domain-containing protein [Achromobacter animicus]|uniref:CHASE4 domain-containing protein n=1 Tax=Achromobacter animicus TaxID=1389935 RepID=UPI001465CF90|nr:CHASE4 domain-containing protein [Achromobacter animicus]CAB3910595.1 hypothetical protein LMG26691_04976 [Achromobacter animicus]
MRIKEGPLPRSAGGLLVLLLIAFVGFLAAMLFSLHLSVDKSDDMAAMRQSKELQQAISNTLDDVAQAQEAVAIWDMLADELAKPAPDQAWLDDNVGAFLHRLFEQDLVFILGPNNTVRFGNVHGELVPPERYAVTSRTCARSSR